MEKTFRKNRLRLFSIITMCTLILSTFSVGSMNVSAQENNGILNADFEEVADGKPVSWTVAGSTVESSIENVYSGTYSVKFADDSTENNLMLISSKAAVKPGNMYEASVYSYNESGVSQLYLQFYNENNERIGYVIANNSVQKSWKKVFARGIAPKGAAYATVLLYSGKSGTCVSYFDNANIIEFDKGLINSGFESVNGTKPSVWTLSPEEKCEVSAQQVYEGDYSLRINDDSNDMGVFARSNPIVAESGSMYEASVYSYNETGVSQLYLEFFNIKDERIGVIVVDNNNAKKWYKMTAKGVAPADTAYARLLLYAHKSNIGVCYFDNASFKKLIKELVNGGFENITSGKPDSWWSDTPNKYAASTEKVNAGTYSIKVTDDSSTLPVTIKSNQIFVEQGSEYQAFVDSYNENGTSVLSLEFYDSDDVLVESFNNQNTTAGQWKTMLVKATVPYKASYAVLSLSTGEESTGVTYFDEAKFSFLTDEPAREFPLKEVGHPRLFFTKKDIEELKAKASDSTPAAIGTSGKALWAGIESTARAYLTETSFTISYYGGYNVTYPLPPQMPGPMAPPPGFTAGNYPYWTMMARNIQQRLETLSIAYCITGEQAFAERAKEYALAVASWDYWTDTNYAPAGTYTCLDTAHLTLGVSTTYDILYDYLSEDERTILENALVLKGLEPLYKDTRAKIDHNIQMLRACALGSGGAVILGKNDNAEKYLTRATDYYKWYLDMRMSSGQQEGLMYTSYALDNLMRSIDHLARTTGERTLIEHPFINDFIVRWANYTLTPGGASGANFSDCSLGNNFYITMSVINSNLDNGYAGWYLANAKPSAEPLDRCIYFKPNIKITSPEALDSSIVLDEIGWAALRSGWSNEDTMLAFVSNNSYLGHNHYDQNSFILATNNTQMATDPGYQDYSPGPTNDFTLKYGHSTIRVDGKPQAALGGGTITKGLLSEDYDYIKGSAANAYSSPSLERFDRHIVFVKPDYYVIYDDLKADTPRNYDWILYTADAQTFEVDGTPVTKGQSVTGEQLYVQKGSAQMAARFLAPEPLPITVETYPGAESYGPYIKVGSGSQKAEQKFLTVLKAAPYKQNGTIKAVDMGAPVETSGREYKVVNVNGNAVFFYKALDVDDYVTLRFNVSEAGEYDVGAMFIKSPLYGQLQVSIDGRPVGSIYDGYSSVVTEAPLFELGRMYLEEGSHTINFRAVGKNENSGNYFIGVNSIELTRSDSTNTPNIEKLSIDAEFLQGTGAEGASVKRGENNEYTDIIVFKDVNAESFSIGEVAGNAEQALVSDAGSSALERFAMTRGSCLVYNGRTLLSGSSKFSASLSRDDSKGILQGVIETASNTNVSIYAGANGKVTLNGQQLQDGSFAYDEINGLISFSVPAGTNKVILDMHDTIPPVTELKADGNINNSWYTGNVTITLAASDEQSTVMETVYSLDLGKTWLKYEEPFTISNEGENTIKFYSIDKSGNAEEVNTSVVKIDKTAPLYTILVNGEMLYDGMTVEDADKFLFTATVEDSLSGVSEVILKVDGIVYKPGEQINFAGKPGEHIINIYTADNAGNEIQKDVKIVVQTSIESMELLLEQFNSSGEVRGPLHSQLANNLAQSRHQLKKGSKHQAAKHMEDLLRHLNNEALKENISDTAKAVIEADAKALIQLWKD